MVRNLGLVERIASIYSALPVAAFERSLHDSPAAAEGARQPTDETRWTWGPLLIVERIGRGTYADVYLARYSATRPPGRAEAPAPIGMAATPPVKRKRLRKHACWRVCSTPTSWP